MGNTNPVGAASLPRLKLGDTMKVKIELDISKELYDYLTHAESESVAERVGTVVLPIINQVVEQGKERQNQEKRLWTTFPQVQMRAA